MTDRLVRVAAGQGFWGDWLEAPVRQVNGGPIDYLMMDYLAEVTMSIMQKQKSRDPKAGYARDFVPLMERILPEVVKRRIKVTSNAGGVNPRGCAEAVLDVAQRLGLTGRLNIGLVTGDDILGTTGRAHPRRTCAGEHGDRTAAGRHPRQGAVGQRLPRDGAHRRGAPARRGRGDHRPGHRYRAHAGSHLSRVRLAQRRLGQGCGGDRRRPHHRVRRTGLRRQPAERLALGEGIGEPRISHRRGLD